MKSHDLIRTLRLDSLLRMAQPHDQHPAIQVTGVCADTRVAYAIGGIKARRRTGCRAQSPL